MNKKNLFTINPIIERVKVIDKTFDCLTSDGWDKIYEGYLDSLLEEITIETDVPKCTNRPRTKANRRRAEITASAARLRQARDMGFDIDDQREIAKVAKGTNTKLRQDLHTFSQYNRNGYIGKGEMKGFRKISHIEELWDWDEDTVDTVEEVSSFEEETGLEDLRDRWLDLWGTMSELTKKMEDLKAVLNFWSGFTPESKVVSLQKEQELRVLRTNIEGVMKDISTYNTELVEVEKEIQNILRWFVR